MLAVDVIPLGPSMGCSGEDDVDWEPAGYDGVHRERRGSGWGGRGLHEGREGGTTNSTVRLW